jgi:Cu-Zn family superoxide dismutase
MKGKLAAWGLGLLGMLLIAGCGETGPLTAKSTLMDAKGQKVGEATLTEIPQGVKIVLKVEKLLPGVHAFHIHEKGACGAPDFANAGAHFNPFGKKHGLKSSLGPHAGDLPNLYVGPDGKGAVEVTATLVTLKEGPVNSLFHPGGTSLVVHAYPDDDFTDPAGNAGPRIACGVISK